MTQAPGNDRQPGLSTNGTVRRQVLDMSESTFEIELSYVDGTAHEHVFRVAFLRCTGRVLLPYPSVTGLEFADENHTRVAEFQTRYLVSEPRDEFVLESGARIAFDITAYVNVEPTEDRRWVIPIPEGEYDVTYVYTADADAPWYDYLAKQSRFAALTPPWGGTVRSNSIRLSM